MDVGEKLEKIRFEQTDGFFIVDDLMADWVCHGLPLLSGIIKTAYYSTIAISSIEVIST